MAYSVAGTDLLPLTASAVAGRRGGLVTLVELIPAVLGRL